MNDHDHTTDPGFEEQLADRDEELAGSKTQGEAAPHAEKSKSALSPADALAGSPKGDSSGPQLLGRSE